MQFRELSIMNVLVNEENSFFEGILKGFGEYLLLGMLKPTPLILEARTS
jgi:hypothetical protein